MYVLVVDDVCITEGVARCRCIAAWTAWAAPAMFGLSLQILAGADAGCKKAGFGAVCIPFLGLMLHQCGEMNQCVSSGVMYYHSFYL